MFEEVDKMDGLKKKVLSNFIWRFAERSGAQIVTFIVSILLARLLEPEVYGTVALITVFTTILQVFVDSGLSTALIQKKDADDVDFSTVFYFNLVMCLGLYAIMFVAAPLIAEFYNDLSLVALIRFVSLTIVISGVKGIQQAYVSRNMLFKLFFFSTFWGTIFSAVLGIGLAYAGCGVWAIAVQQVANTAVDTLILWFTVKWRPKKKFDIKRMRVLFSFGWKMLISALLDTGYNNLRSLIIGKLYSSVELAYFNQGKQIPNVVVNNINASIDSVLLPTMSEVQEEKMRVKSMTRRAIKTSTYIMAPLMMGMFATAKPIVTLLLTEKWLPSVPFLRIFCISFIFQPIHTANLNAIKAMGRSDLFLKLEVIKKAVGIFLLLFTIRFGVMAMAYSLLVGNVLSQIINSWPNSKLLDYSYLEQLRDILPNILLAVGMGVGVWMLEFCDFSMVITLFTQIVLGITVYIAGSILWKNDSFTYLWSGVKSMLGRKSSV